MASATQAAGPRIKREENDTDDEDDSDGFAPGNGAQGGPQSQATPGRLMTQIWPPLFNEPPASDEDLFGGYDFDDDP